MKGVVFDKDGTLFDFQATWGSWTRAMIAAEAAGDAALEDRLAEALGFDLASGRFRPASVVIASTTETVAETLLAVLPGRDKAALMARMDAEAARAPQVAAAPLDAVLSELAAMGLALGVATNDSEAPARAHLRAAGIDGHFPFVAGFDSGWGGKPAPGQLLAFAQAAGLDPADCAMVGDSRHDLDAGRAAGMAAVAVLTGVADRAALEPHADVVLTSIAALPAWIAGRR